ncbi:HEPN domain-containing protein [Candidatus Chloroploca sp. Khr17]|uniref:HEPN domain-containing protein n=1 Tax=Candidatus Chloroploca sp. Khr17 TaxID=2496869 RepID=UPI00101D3879|nr:HEPN domain-containing protein [Candidatus Chloroploca sp. Khr17]
MAGPHISLGRREHRLSDVAAEYLVLAQQDEQVGLLLIRQGQYRHGISFLVQAMEKYVRSTIFGLVNPNTEYFRNRTRTHDLDDLLDFLIEIACANPAVHAQVREQLRDFVLGGIRFGKLHNDLRYPAFSMRYQSYSLLSVSRQDADLTLERLQTLKRFLKDIHQLRR